MIKKLFVSTLAFMILLNLVSASYVVSNPQFTNPQLTTSFLSGVTTQTNIFNSEMCQSGQDFIMQIVPGGCTPTIVRSDLLEQQDVPVFCPIEAMKINPAVNIQSITSVSFGGNYPPEVETVDFLPSYPALGLNSLLNNMQWNQVGYAVIFLKQWGGNESALPDFVTGNLSATVQYNAYDAFGSVDRTMYLPLLTDSQFNDLQGQYAFFNNMGYLRADNIQTNSATVSIYSAINSNPLDQSTNVQKQKILSYNLNVGQSSPNFFLPGFGCFASSTLQLDSIGGADTRAVIRVNSEEFDVKKGETFLDGKCAVTSDPIKEGLRESVDISCNTDQGGKSFTLRIEPTINLSINGSTKPYQVGDYLYSYKDENVYLGYVGTDPNANSESLTNSLVYLVAIPSQKNIPGQQVPKLDSSTLADVSNVAGRQLKNDQNIGDFAKNILGNLAQGFQWLLSGNSYQKITYGSPQNAFGENVQIVNFGAGTNLPFNNATLTGYYGSAAKEYQQIKDNYASEVYPDGTPTTLGEESLSQLINLSSILQQNEDLKKYCDEFETRYPKSTLDISPCRGVPKYSNAGVSTQTILVNGEYMEISFDGINVPSINDYGVGLTIRKGNQVQTVSMAKGDTIYLDSLFGTSTSQIFSLNNAIGNAKVYFEYTNLTQSSKPQWYWSTDEKNWMSTSGSSKVTAGPLNGQSPAPQVQQVIASLSGVNFTDGQTKIFGAQGNPEYQESVTLNQITDQNDAVFNFNLANFSKTGAVINFLTSNSYNLKLNVPNSVNSNNYVFTLSKISLSKVAKVSVHTNIRDTSNVNFQFKIGIEKRGIQLSPDQIRSQITTTGKLNAKLQSISSSLGKVVNTMQDVCLGVGAVLTIKNLIANSGTEAAARSQVMNGAGGWNSICAGLKVNGKVYSTVDQCLLDNSNQIEKDVSQMSSAMDTQNNEILKIQEISGVVSSGGLFGNDVVNETKLMESYAPDVVSSLPSTSIADPNNPKATPINPSILSSYLTSASFNQGGFTLDQAKQIELYSNLYKQDPSNTAYQSGLYAALDAVQVGANQREKGINVANTLGIKANQVTTVQIKNAQAYTYTGATLGSMKNIQIPGSGLNTPVAVMQPTSGGEYIALLDNAAGTSTYPIKRDQSGVMMIYDLSGNRITDKNILSQFNNIYFTKPAGATGNAIKNQEVDYYNTGTYAGFPALVPIDPENGWYAYIQDTSTTASPLLSSTTATTSSQRAYDASARVNSFWICNAEQNGLMTQSTTQNNCQLINLGNSGTYAEIMGLTADQSKSMLNNAITAINQAQLQYKAGVSSVVILGHRYPVGTPATSTPTTQCTDIMSPSDCKLLFNACDPVICPSSRCNFGGQYPVQNVIQSGVLGSIMLCLPNAQEGIYVPVCLTGVKAGLDNIISVLNSYQSCLNTSLNTGQTVGICNEIESVYFCQLGWNQALPLINLGVPRIDSLIFGTGAGGGEYVGGIQGALKNAENSVNYFTQTYAVGAFDAFKARSQSEIGTAVCQNAMSLAYPQGQGLLDALSQTQSPPQYTGNFQTIPFSTVTNPPQSQYNVYYHIFAGNDAGAYYQVYLKNSGGSYYQDTSVPRIVDSGYIPAGQSEDNTKVFTGPEGYDQLCIQVNNQENCGFGTVSTDFALNYLSDQYVKAQATSANITTQSACLSGSSNLMTLLNPNIQNGITNTVSPDLSASGVTRVCASVNPGSNSDPYMNTTKQRWIQVGYCGSQNVKCWIDTQSIAGATNFQVTANQTLQSLSTTLAQEIANQSGLMTDAQFSNVLSTIINTADPKTRINLIENVYNKVFGNNKKAYLLYLEGGAYSNLSINLFRSLMQKGMILLPTSPGGQINLSGVTVTPQNSGTQQTVNYANVYSVPQNFVSSQYTLREGAASSICLMYNGSEGWLFRNTNCADITPKNDYGQGGAITLQNPWYTIADASSAGLNNNDYFFISQLAGNDFLTGLNRTVEYAKSIQNSWTSFLFGLGKTSLNAGNTTMDNAGIFTFDGPNVDVINQNTDLVACTISQIYFNYTNLYSGWKWSTDDKNWQSVLTINPPSGPNCAGGTISGYYKNIISNLTDKSFAEGAAYLFENRNFFTVTQVPLAQSPSSGTSSAVIQQSTLQQCSQYYSEVQNAASNYSIDPNLLLAVMIQESNCNPSTSSDSSYGLMQINPNYWCGKFGLPSNITQCQNSLLSDTQENINVGAQILASYYNQYAGRNITFNGCNVQGVNYSGWNASLRIYNGLGCNLNYPAQDYYVENVNNILNQLKNLNIFSNQTLTGATCPVITPPASISSLTTAQEKVLEAAKELNGTPASRVEFKNCWDAASYIYTYAGVTWSCVYSDPAGKQYSVDGNTNTITTTSSSSGPFVVNPTLCPIYSGDKLAGIQPGDLLSIYYGNDEPHNVLFISWANQANQVANLYDWNGPGGTYHYFTESLSDSQHPVYMYWEPATLQA